MSEPIYRGEILDVRRLACENCAALQRQINDLLAERASRSNDTPKAKRAASLPRMGQRLRILHVLRSTGDHKMPNEFPAGALYGSCPWKRLSELHQLGLVERTDYGAYFLSAAGYAHLSNLEVRP